MYGAFLTPQLYVNLHNSKFLNNFDLQAGERVGACNANPCRTRLTSDGGADRFFADFHCFWTAFRAPSNTFVAINEWRQKWGDGACSGAFVLIWMRKCQTASSFLPSRKNYLWSVWMHRTEPDISPAWWKDCWQYYLCRYSRSTQPLDESRICIHHS